MKKTFINGSLLLLSMLLIQCADVNNESVWNHYTTGRATWYGPGFHGRTTASGETFNKYKLTAAHRTLKFGTEVRVTNLSNNKKVIVRITDRGPVSKKFIIDLSEKAAERLDMKEAGVVPVKLEIHKTD
jgi:rare lipoprotein A